MIASEDKEPHVWHSDDHTRAVITFKIDGKASEEKVRNQSAGMFDEIANPSLLLNPHSARFVSLSGLPGIRLDGVSYAGGGRREYSMIALFGTDRSYLVHCVAPLGEKIDDWEKKTGVSGEGYDRARALLEECVSKVNRDIAQLQALMRKEIKKATGREPDDTAQRP